MLHFFFDFFFEEGESSFFLFTLTDSLSDLFVVFNIAVGEYGFELFFVLGEFLFVAAFFVSEVPEFLFFLFVLAAFSDAAFQNAQKFISSLLFILCGTKLSIKNYLSKLQNVLDV